jgi:aminoglycoside 6'-N-acetyltransferase I
VAIRIRFGQPSDREQLARLRTELWPDSSIEEHSRELTPILAGKPPGTMPLVILVADVNDEMLIGFLEAGLRSHADGCDTAFPVGYVEGWYVSEKHRGKRVGADLMAAAQDWARTQGCVEMASDTWFDNHLSQRVHEALGFEVVDRCVNYRKKL